MDNASIAAQFEDLASLLELEGANAFRVRAYRNAARTLESLTDSLADLVAADPDQLQELPGIGKDLAEKIERIVQTGQLPQLEELKARIPADVVTMLRIPGLGPKKVAVLFHELHLTTLDQLKDAAERGIVSQQKGFGKKTEQIILEGLEHLAQAGSRFYLADVQPLVAEIVAGLRELADVSAAEPAGSVRRLKETIGDLDVVVAADSPAAPMQFLAEHPRIDKVLAQGETKQIGRASCRERVYPRV